MSDQTTQQQTDSDSPSMQTQQQTQNANLPAPTREQQLAAFSPRPLGQCMSNIPMDTVAGRELIASLEAGFHHYTEKTYKQPTISIRYFHLQWVHDAPDDNGELRSFVVTMLVMPDGMVIKFGSGGVVDSIRSIVRNIGFGPYDPPLLVKLHKMPAKKGDRFVLAPCSNSREQ